MGIMSHKAVGSDWKKSSEFTLRHAAGAKKYTSLSKWEKRAKLKAEKARLKAQPKQIQKQTKITEEKKGKKENKMEIVRMKEEIFNSVLVIVPKEWPSMEYEKINILMGSSFKD